MFRASQFTKTPWASQADKLKFANHLVRFIEAGYPRSMFAKWFYTRLSNCFGHIAHYNAEGFYAEWFATPRDQYQFLQNIRRWPCHGQAKYTFSDVEKAIQQWLHDRDLEDVA